MRSWTALLWEIWRQHRSTIAVIVALTVAGRLVDVLDSSSRAAEVAADSSPLTVLLSMVAFLLLLGVFNFTEASDNRGLGRFPRRLFTLPVTSLRLVTVPMLSAVASMELLYLLWMPALSRDGTVSVPFVALLFGALAVFYLCTLWTLERAGSLRLIVLGVIAIVVFVVGMLPTFPPTPPPFWRSEFALANAIAGLAGVAFLLAWCHVERLRTGGEPAPRTVSLFGWVSAATSTRRRAFASADAAQFWFEWRASGLVLPALVGSILLLIVMPATWLVRSHARETFLLLLAALATPMVLAVPVGIAFSKPTFWSEDLAVPAFIAVRPVSSEDLVAIKLKVAAMSAALTWLIVLAFVTACLLSSANLDFLATFAIQLWTLYGRSVAAVFGIAALAAIAGLFLTWRCLVSRLWSGLSGMRPLLVGSVASIVTLIVAGVAFDGHRLPGWLLADPARVAPLAWIAAVAVVAKYWMAVYTWRRLAPHYLRTYLPIWFAGTASCLGLGLVVWDLVRLYVPIDVDRVRSIVILMALLAMPLARVALAPAMLTRNRHRDS